MADQNSIRQYIKNGVYTGPEHFKGDINLRDYQDDVDFSKLVSVEGGLDLINAKITNIPNLVSVGGHLDLGDSNILDLSSLQSVEGYVFLVNSNILSLPNLQSVEGYLDIRNSKILDLPKLVSVKYIIYIEEGEGPREPEEFLKELQIINNIEIPELVKYLTTGNKEDFFIRVARHRLDLNHN